MDYIVRSYIFTRITGIWYFHNHTACTKFNWGKEKNVESKKMDRRVRKTRMQLRSGLTQLMREKPIKDITVRELAQLVDINRCTFYLHYRDIYDMVEQVEQEVFEEFETLVLSHPSSELQHKPLAILLDLYEFFAANADLCTAFLGGNGDMSFGNGDMPFGNGEMSFGNGEMSFGNGEMPFETYPL